MERPSDAAPVAKRFIDEAMNEVLKRLTPIPDPEAYSTVDDDDDDDPSPLAVKLSRAEKKIVERLNRDVSQETAPPRARRKPPARKRARSTLFDGLGSKTGTDGSDA
jgi:hypothetical protein